MSLSPDDLDDPHIMWGHYEDVMATIRLSKIYSKRLHSLLTVSRVWVNIKVAVILPMSRLYSTI